MHCSLLSDGNCTVTRSVESVEYLKLFANDDGHDEDDDDDDDYDGNRFMMEEITSQITSQRIF